MYKLICLHFYFLTIGNELIVKDTRNDVVDAITFLQKLLSAKIKAASLA